MAGDRDGMISGRHKIIFFLLAALAAFLVFMPGLWAGFVNWDDSAYVFENAHLRSFDLKWAFSAVVVGNWLPLTLLSYALDYAIWGYSPFGYHLTNNILHAANTGLVLLLCLRLASARKMAAFESMAFSLTAALLFGLHPLRVESVVWVSERKDVLCAFFFLLAMLSYLRYATLLKKGWYVLTLVLFALALMSKPMAVTLPLVLLIIDFYPLERFKRSFRLVLVEKIPFFILSAASAAVALWAQRLEGALSSIDTYPFWMRALVALRALGFYIFKSVFPSGLAPFYPLPDSGEIFDFSLLASAALVMTISSICLFTLKRTKALSAAWLYFLVTLLPVIGLVQVGSQAAADRYTYLPLIGPAMLIGALAAFVFGRLHRARAVAFYSALLFVFAILTALSAVTVRQIGFWHDPIALWRREIALYPQVSLAYSNRALAYDDRGMYTEAIADYSSVISIDPGSASAYNNRGLIYDRLKMYREAIADFDIAIAVKPDYALAYNNRGNAYKSLGELRPAIDDFTRAAHLAPGMAEPYINLAAAYFEAGEPGLAYEARERANELRGAR